MATYTKTGTANADNYTLANFNGNQPGSGNVYVWDGGLGTDKLTLGSSGGSYLANYPRANFTINPVDASGVIVVTGASRGGTQLTLNLKSVETLVFADATVSLVYNANHSPTGAVTISGTAIQGAQLTATNTLADADGLGTISYQWYAAGTAIAGATSSTLTLAEAQVGNVMTVHANYTDLLGTAESVSSGSTAAVLNVNDAPTGAVTISGTASTGQTLTASNTLADADGLGVISYQWNVAGVAVAGATGNTHLLTPTEADKSITVTASYIDGHGTPESVTSAATGAVFTNHAPTGLVTIAGTATQNQQLTASNTLADVDGLGTISYQWYAAGTPIAGATASTLTLAEAQVGKAITVHANYTDGHGTAESVSSGSTAAVINVNDAPTGAVTIGGTATQYHQLDAVTSTLADADGLGIFSYQWYADHTAIAGATAGSLTLAAAQLGKVVTVAVNYTDGHGTAESVTSAATTAVVTDTIAPTITTFTPADGATGVAVGSNLVVNFDEAIQNGTGLIEIHSGSATGALVASYDAATSTNLTISGSTLTINPTADLAPGTHYFVLLPDGSVSDLAGNHFAGNSLYDFTTVAAAGADPYAASSGGGGGAGVALAGVGALGILSWALFF